MVLPNWSSIEQQLAPRWVPLAQTPFRSIHNFNVEKRILIKLNQNAYRFLITPSFTAKINEGGQCLCECEKKAHHPGLPGRSSYFLAPYWF
jgi:hypothetical protein